MERLTSNKEVSEMNVYELAHNSCYGKDGKARVRDFENDYDARELTIKLLEQYADIPNEFTCDEDFDDFISDSLQYGMKNILGLIAVFYEHLWAMANLWGRLKEYEDLEEQNRLLKLPCAVGDTVYSFCRDKILDFRVQYFTIYQDHTEVRIVSDMEEYKFLSVDFDVLDFGKKWFASKEEAEAALKELTEGK